MMRHARSLIPLLTIAATLGGCSENDSASTQGQGGAVANIGGLGNYDYSNDAGFGGYAGFASQPWAGGHTVMGTGGRSASSGGTRSTSMSSATGEAIGTGGNSPSTGGNSPSTGGNSPSTGGNSPSTGGNSPSTGGTPTSGGTASTGGAAGTGLGFDWGSTSYDVTGGSAVGHQTHNVGAACLASCHTHPFQAGATVYAADGTTGSANVQVGIRMNGTLYTAYSGSRGNFYLPISGTANWANAQVAVRNSNGTLVHPGEPGLSGNCNGCHTSSNRIISP